MALTRRTLTITGLQERTLELLYRRAARHGHSLEDEVVDILRFALAGGDLEPAGLGTAIRRRFAAVGYVDLPVADRAPMRSPPTFD